MRQRTSKRVVGGWLGGGGVLGGGGGEGWGVVGVGGKVVCIIISISRSVIDISE